ncbi:MAG: DNA-3-methyladenine glycosylase I [Proteobacteria bacterium]|nr:DNA-3-methyladenine glycosylase I [Pseudomonadota bacterium]
MSAYCDIAPGHPLHGPYHDREYGFPLADDAGLFERLSLEIFQAGLSWLIVLKKRPALVAAFAGFDPARVAAFRAAERGRLLADAAIIRNRRKIEAVIENARRANAIIAREGSLDAWLARHHPMRKADWVGLFRDTFVFMGGEVVGEFLLSVGYLPGAHRSDCPVHARILRRSPPWMRPGPAFYVED